MFVWFIKTSETTGVNATAPTYPRWISSGSAGSGNASCRRCSVASGRRQRRFACPPVQQSGSAVKWRDSTRAAHPGKQQTSHMWAGRNDPPQCKDFAVKLNLHCDTAKVVQSHPAGAVSEARDRRKEVPEGCRWCPRRFCWRRPVDKLQSGSVKTS